VTFRVSEANDGRGREVRFRRQLTIGPSEIAPPYDFGFQLRHYVVAPEARDGRQLVGAEDTAKAGIHASDESVDPAEIEAMILAQVFLVQDLARGRRDHG
jgi:hypothetical protein